MSECVWCGAVDSDDGEIVVAIANDANETVCNICLQDAYRNWEIDPMDDQWTAWAKRQMSKRPPAEISHLIGSGLSAAEALDYYMVEMGTHSQSSWARVRSVSQQTVSENVSKARKKLDK